MIQPNRWSCLPTAFSIVEGIDPTDFIQEIGHDGGEIVNNLEEPFCRRGFHPQEIYDVLYKRNIHYQEIEYEPTQEYMDGQIKCYFTNTKERMDKYIRENSGVIVGYYPSGKGHAYANKRGYIYDPSSGIQCPLPKDFRIQSFYMRVQ